MQQLRSAIHNAIARFLKNQPPARIIAVGFALLILLGAALLMLPFAVHPGAHVGPLDALFTATSAVCVTGLVVVDTGDTFSLFGQAVIAILIQIGGLGVASIGMGLALVAGRRISLKGRSLVREALNVESLEGMVRLVRAILLVTLIWGLNFVVIKVGLGDFPPLLFCALRFALAALPLLVLRGPMPAPFGRILLIGVLLGVVKFGLLFVGMAQGMPAGLSSLVLQSQVFFTILIAALWLGERPTPRGLFGLLLAAAGLVLIGLERPLGDSLLAFLLVVAAALAWSFANIATKRSGATDMLRLICWVSLVPPLPLLALSYLFEGPQAIERAVLNMSWGGFGALLYIAFGATTVGFAIWSFLLRHYPASLVTPFALAVPVSGMLAGWLLLGERLDLDSLLACALVFVGLAITLLPASLLRRFAWPVRRLG